MATGYQINVAHCGQHFFRIECGVAEEHARRVTRMIIKRFPVAEGYAVNLQWCEVSFTNVDVPTILGDQ